MNESILKTIKKLIGIDPNYGANFDKDLITAINSVLAILCQLGVGPKNGFSITGNSETWDQYYDGADLNLVQSYIGLKVKLLFDPPQNNSLFTSMENLTKEFEWRLNVQGESEEA